MLDKARNRHWALWGILCGVTCLAYFSLLDHAVFSSRGFTPIFRHLLVVYDARYALLGVSITALAAMWRRPGPVLALVDHLAAHPRAVALAAIPILGLGTRVVYHDYALCMDEYAAVFQAKIFAAGQLTARLPPQLVAWLVPGGFNGAFLVASSVTGRAIEAYWPGFALLMAPFQLLDAGWLCNPVLSALALILIFRITREITGEPRAAGFAMLFALASGAFVADGISFYAMQAHLALNLTYAWLLLRPTAARAGAAGAVGSLALVLHNPVPHALFAAPWLMAMLADREQRRLLPWVIAGYLPLTLLAGGGWLLLRQSIEAGAHAVTEIGGVAGRIFVWPDRTLLNMRAAALVKMWVWAVPCLYLFAVAGWFRHRGHRAVRLLAQSACLTLVGYLFVDLDQGHGWGYRYFHSAWGVVPILAGCAFSAAPGTERRQVAFAGALSVLSLLLLVPFQLSQIDAFITQHLAQLPAPRRPGNNVLFVQATRGSYLGDAIQTDPLLRAPDLILVSHGAARDTAFVRAQWPDAVRLPGTPFVQQWSLGAEDQRRQEPPGRGPPRFVFDAAPVIRAR